MSEAAPLLSSQFVDYTNRNSPTSSPPQEMLLNGERGMYSLSREGILVNNSTLVLPFDSVVGITRTETKITLVSYVFQHRRTLLSCCLPTRSTLRIRNVDVIDCKQEDMARTWELEANRILFPDGETQRHFLVLINPKSGTGKSEKIFNKYCAPVFEDANIRCTLLKTTKPGHASEFCAKSEEIPHFNGIVVVSGDGMMFETLQGLMKRADWAKVIQAVPLGIIPGGSGNGLAHSLAHGSGENKAHPTSNAFLIAKGVKAPMDLCMVDHATKGRLYSFLSMEYGLACEIDVGSEYMRSLGEARFTLHALRLLVNPKSTKLKFSYLPVVGEPKSPAQAPKLDSYWKMNGYAGEGGPRSLLSAEEQQRWETIEADVYLMWNCNVAWMSGSANVSPQSKVDDGYTQVCIYRKQERKRHVRWHMAKLLLALENGSHYDFSYLDMFPTRAYELEPLPVLPGEHKTMIAVDGEEVPLDKIRFEVLPGICTVMGVLPQHGGVQDNALV